MDIATDEFKKKYPNLSKEIEKSKMRVGIDPIRTQAKGEDKSPKTLSGYMPDIVAFIRRCNSADEAKEIIDFFEKRGEISHEYAMQLHDQLRKGGLRSFGSKKEFGYYFKQGKV